MKTKFSKVDDKSFPGSILYKCNYATIFVLNFSFDKLTRQVYKYWMRKVVFHIATDEVTDCKKVAL